MRHLARLPHPAGAAHALLLVLLAGLSAAAAPRAQGASNPAGLVVFSSGGIGGGVECGPFTCQAPFATLHSSLNSEVRAFGPPHALYGVAASAFSTSCVAIPGIGGMLVLGNPSFAISSGVLPAGPLNSCGLARAVTPLPVPQGFGGLRLTFQSVVVDSAGQASLSTGVAVTIRS